LRKEERRRGRGREAVKEKKWAENKNATLALKRQQISGVCSNNERKNAIPQWF